MRSHCKTVSFVEERADTFPFCTGNSLDLPPRIRQGTVAPTQRTTSICRRDITGATTFGPYHVMKSTELLLILPGVHPRPEFPCKARHTSYDFIRVWDSGTIRAELSTETPLLAQGPAICGRQCSRGTLAATGNVTVPFVACFAVIAVGNWQVGRKYIPIFAGLVVDKHGREVTAIIIIVTA